MSETQARDFDPSTWTPIEPRLTIDEPEWMRTIADLEAQLAAKDAEIAAHVNYAMSVQETIANSNHRADMAEDRIAALLDEAQDRPNAYWPVWIRQLQAKLKAAEQQRDEAVKALDEIANPKGQHVNGISVGILQVRLANARETARAALAKLRTPGA